MFVLQSVIGALQMSYDDDDDDVQLYVYKMSLKETDQDEVNEMNQIMVRVDFKDMVKHRKMRD